MTEKSKSENKTLYLRHLHFIDFENYGEKNPIYINIIRNPVEHWISNYYFLRNGFEKDQKLTPEQKKKWETKWKTDPNKHLSIEECIEKGLSDCVNIYSDLIPFFCGNDAWCRKRDRKALEAAKKNISGKYLFVGVLEDIENSLKLLELYLPNFFSGMSEILDKISKKLKTGSVTLNKKDDSEEVKKYLGDRLVLELELYEFVRQLMLVRVKKDLKI